MNLLVVILTANKNKQCQFKKWRRRRKTVIYLFYTKEGDLQNCDFSIFYTKWSIWTFKIIQNHPGDSIWTIKFYGSAKVTSGKGNFDSDSQKIAYLLYFHPFEIKNGWDTKFWLVFVRILKIFHICGSRLFAVMSFASFCERRLMWYILRIQTNFIKLYVWKFENKRKLQCCKI